MPFGDLSPELVLLGGAVLILLHALVAPRRYQAWAAGLAVLTLLVAAAAAVILLSGAGQLTFHGTYAVDGAALWGKLLVLGVTAGVIALSVEWFIGDPRHGEYYTLLLLAALGAVAMAGAADLMQLVLAVLLSSATAAVLIAYHRRSRRAGEAALKFYLLGALANGAMVFGVALLFGLAGTTTYAGLLATLPASDPLTLVVAVGLVVVGLAFKLGAVPVHSWLPDAADGAPAPVAAFVAAVPKIGALIALARLMAVVPEHLAEWRVLIAVLAAATMTLGNVAALWQDDVRRLLGWSAVSQSGYGMMAVVALGRSSLAIPALLYFLVAYALATVVAFGVVVALRGEADRRRYAGLARAHPWLAFALLVSFLSFIGIPPLVGFGAKLTLFTAALDAGYGWLAVVAIVNTALSVAYYIRVLVPVYFEPASDATACTSSALPLTAIAVGVAGIIVLGIFGETALAAFRGARLLPG